MSYTLPNLAAMLDFARSSFVVAEDFCGPVPIDTSSPFSLRAQGTGAGASSAVLIGDNSPGVIELTTGSTNTGSAELVSGYDAALSSTNASMLRHAAGIKTVFEARIQVPTLSVNASEEFDVYVGGSLTVQYAHFHYNVDLSANWIVSNDDAGGSPTTTTSGVAVVAGTWCRMRIVVDGVTSVSYFLDDVLIAKHTTNIPSAQGPLASIIKTVGTSARGLRVDYMAYAQYGLSR